MTTCVFTTNFTFIPKGKMSVARCLFLIYMNPDVTFKNVKDGKVFATGNGQFAESIARQIAKTSNCDLNITKLGE